jgi:hypothetical protein
MIVHPNDSRFCLVTVSDIEKSSGFAPLITENYDVLAQTLVWARSYLTRPHPDLGRRGAVCPYVRASLEKNLFFMAVYRGSHFDQNDVVGIVSFYRQWFGELEPLDPDLAALKTILILFPDLKPEAVEEVVEQVQEDLKPEYVEEGLMLGEFHAGPPKKAGLWNPAFRPLYSPIPLLAIRNMVATDFPFLRSNPVLFKTYLERFSDNIPNHIRQAVIETAYEYNLDYLLEAEVSVAC